MATFVSLFRAMHLLLVSCQISVPFRRLIPTSGIVLGTAGSYIFFDRSVSSPEAPSEIALPQLILDALAYHSPVTSLTAIPAIMSQIVALSSQIDVERLRLLHSLGVGGAPTSEGLFQWAATLGIQYFDCSGATEAAGTVCIRRAGNPKQRETGLQVIPEVMGCLEKINLEDQFGELVLRGTVSLVISPFPESFCII